MSAKASIRKTGCLTAVVARLGTGWALEHVFLLLLSLLMMPMAAGAQFSYIATNGAVTITGYAGPGGTVTIPDKIGGLPVTRIADYAFQTQGNLTNVALGNSVTNLGYQAFYYCENLTNVSLGSNVTRIGDYAFFGCAQLKAFTVDALNPALSSVDGVLYDKNQATLLQYPGGKAGNSFTVPTNVAMVASWAFGNCGGLTSVALPDNLARVGTFAFAYCTNLAGITIPDRVTSIGAEAFFHCYSLTNAALGTNVALIGDYAFLGCSRLQAITVSPLNRFFSSLDGVLYDKSQTTVLQYPAGKAGASYTVPAGVRNIGNWAFASSLGLASVTLPRSVTNLGAFAFADCANLASLTMPDSLSGIGYQALRACTNLAAIYFPGDAPTTGAWSELFSDATKATVYYLPGTSGWAATFGGRPTAPWLLPNPVILKSSPGVVSNSFGFTISWATNTSVVVEVASNVNNAVWLPVSTNSFAAGLAYFNDPAWTNYPGRFYRVRWP